MRKLKMDNHNLLIKCKLFLTALIEENDIDPEDTSIQLKMWIQLH